MHPPAPTRNAAMAAPIRLQALIGEFRLYWIFRLCQAGVVLLAFLADDRVLTWRPAHPELGALASVAYLAIGVAMLAASYRHEVRNSLLFHLGALLDLAYINAVLHAAPGALGTTSLLMLTTVAGAALFVRLRTGLAVAILYVASLLAQRWLEPVGDPADSLALTALPLPSLMYFCFVLLFTALILGQIGRKLSSTDRVARARATEILELSALNEQVLKRLPVGVLVVDGAGRIRSSNQVAHALMQAPPSPDSAEDDEAARPALELQQRLDAWRRQQPLQERAPLRMGPDRRRIEPRFLQLHPDSRDVLVFLEDTSQAARHAESITLATLGRLSASLAHEIRNPLAAMRYASQLMAESRNLDAVDRRMLDIVGQQIRRMDGIVDSVLGLARRQPAQPDRFDLDQLIREFDAEYRASFPLDGDRLELQLPNAPVPAQADPAHVHQIAMVLVANARNYGRHPGEPAHVVLRVRAQPPYALHEVRDHGPGIAADDRQALFRPFHTTSSHGTGLGLYIARELALANGGGLDYLPLPDGACFRVMLPMAAGNPAAAG